MTYPKGYEWLGTAGLLPLVITEWLKIYDTREVPGPGNNPVIMGWAAELIRAGVLKPNEYTADSVPWCGLGMAIVCLRAGKPVQAGPLWARNWAQYGTKADRPILGDTLVYSRGTGGHVGTYVGEDDVAFHTFGANQGDIGTGAKADTVGIARIDKARCIAVRRPPFKLALPASAKPYRLTARGALSRNEA